MMQQFIISLLWLAGFGLSYWMLKAEHEADNEEWTNGAKAVQVLLSVFSFLMVLILLAKGWANSVEGYWNKKIKTPAGGTPDPKKAE